jgi:hypothetical protein
MVVQVHYNWALSISAANNYFEYQEHGKVYEFLAEFLEVIAHYDEVMKQYAMITNVVCFICVNPVLISTAANAFISGKTIIPNGLWQSMFSHHKKPPCIFYR